MDSVVLRAIYCWLRRNLIGGKVLSVELSEPKTIAITIRKKGLGMMFLIISWDASLFRLYPTRTRPQKISRSPFVGTLSRHILGATIASILMKSLERVVTFELVNRDLKGNPLEFTLIAELMGKNSNLILVDRKSREIIEAGKHVTEAMSRTRPVLPGTKYTAPPASQGVNPLVATRDEVIQALENATGMRLEKRILSQFAGLSPTIAREIKARAGASSRGSDALARAADAFLSVMAKISAEQFEPCVMREPSDGLNSSGTRAVGLALRAAKSVLCPFPLIQKDNWEVERFESMADAAEAFFAEAEQAAAFLKMGRRLLQIVKSKLARAKRRLAKIEAEAVDKEDVDRLFQKGELLKMNVHEVRRGMASIEVRDVFSSAQPTVTIELQTSLSPWANVDAAFKKAKKAKRRLAHSAKLVASAREEIAYFEGLLLQIEGCEGIPCLQEIADELLRVGVITTRKHDEVVSGALRRLPKEERQRFRRFVSSDGFQILVGRNNRENDLLTLRTARPFDLFVHAQGVPGSHVIVWRANRGSPIPKRTIEEAAIIAALHSKARNALHVPVDYTPRSQVKKPKGSVPGKVIYMSFQTVFVNPDHSLLAKLAAKKGTAIEDAAPRLKANKHK